MGSKKAPRKSASKWSPSSEAALLKVWRENMSELVGCRKNSHIISKMLTALQDQGHNYKEVELRTKMHNVTGRYRKEKRRMVTDDSPSEWEIFKEVDLLLGPYNFRNSEFVVTDNINDMNSSIMYHPLQATLTSPMTSSSALLTPSVTVSSPQTSPTPADSLSTDIPTDRSSAVASSTAAIIKQEGFDKLFKNLETSIEQINKDIKSTTKRMIAIEEEKKEMLKIYVDRESEVQKALIDFLKRS